MVNKFSISGTLVQNQDKRILLKKKRASIAITKRDDDDQQMGKHNTALPQTRYMPKCKVNNFDHSCNDFKYQFYRAKLFKIESAEHTLRNMT